MVRLDHEHKTRRKIMALHVDSKLKMVSSYVLTDGELGHSYNGKYQMAIYITGN